MHKAVALSLLSCCALLCIQVGGLTAAPGSQHLLQSLRPSHPRLLATESELERVRLMIHSEPLARAWYAALHAKAEKMLDEPPVAYTLIGPRLLAQSRRCLERVYTLGLLYRLDGDRRFAERAKQELFAAAAFKDWNPSHFLDVAEMTHAFGIGYDWLFDTLSAAERATLRTAIVEKGLRPSFVDTLPNGARGYNWWLTVTHNWNQVCNGGLTVGALAIADEEPELAERVIRRALDTIKLPMGSYAPDGGWDEGPGYWHYATSYTVYFLAAMATALGGDLTEWQALLRMPGFAVTGDFRVHALGPLGRAFNYADASDRAEAAPELFWLARQFNRPLWAWYERQRSGTPHATDLLWFDPRGDGAKADNVPLDAFFRGINVAFFRSAWEDPQALYVGFKGGNNKANHSHLDLGTFVLDARGYRWAVDLGSDNYDLPGYFGKQRWTYYRLTTAGHNTLLVNGVPQATSARAPIIAFQTMSARAFAVADLTAAYPMTQRVWRGVALLDRERVLIEDEMDAEQPVDVVWSMHTPAEISIDGASAVLKQGAETVQARIEAPAGATFAVASATPSTPDENQNAGIHKLLVRLPDTTGQARIAIVIDPNRDSAKPLTVEPLAAWIATGKK
jgi:hypothetical protein